MIDKDQMLDVGMDNTEIETGKIEGIVDNMLNKSKERPDHSVGCNENHEALSQALGTQHAESGKESTEGCGEVGYMSNQHAELDRAQNEGCDGIGYVIVEKVNSDRQQTERSDEVGHTAKENVESGREQTERSDEVGHTAKENVESGREQTEECVTIGDTTDENVEPSISQTDGFDETDGIENLIIKQAAPKYMTQVSLTEKIAPDGQLKRRHHTATCTDGATSTDKEDGGSVAASEHESITSVKVDERKETTLKINDNVDFCKIVTVRYSYEKNVTKQHYIKTITGQVDGDIGLKQLDELIEVNGQALTNKAQKEVKKIFRNIRINKKDKELQLNLKVRRWQKSPVDNPVWTKVFEIDYMMILVPESRVIKRIRNWPLKRQRDRRLSVKDIKETVRGIQKLSKGNIRVESMQTPYHCRIEVCSNSQYMHWSSDGLLSSNVLDSKSDALFTTEPFNGKDEGPQPFSLIVFCNRFFAEIDGKKMFLTYDPNDFDVYCQLDTDDKIATEAIDERCFIDRSFGNKRLFQSSLDRDLFMFYDSASKQFKMKDIGSKWLLSLQNEEPESYKQFDGCWFQNIGIEESPQPTKLDSMIKLFTCGIARSSGLRRTRNTPMTRGS